MLQPLIRFARRQDVEEIARQYDLLRGVSWMRTGLTALVYGIALAFLPFWVPLLLLVLDVKAEWVGLQLMRGLNPARAPLRYLATVATVAATEAAFTLQVGLLWQIDDAYAKSFATGLVTLTLLQLASLRTIHLPYALTGLATTALMCLGAIVAEWQQSSLPHLLLPVVAMAGAGWFVLVTMQSNHAMHDSIIRDRSAAQAADRAKSRFLAGISHELRTPLNAILGLSHAELAAESDPARRERLELIVSSAHGLSVLVDDVLDLSSIAEGRPSIRPAPASPAAEIRATAALYRPFFEAAGLDLTLRLDPGLPALASLDAQRLRQCLTNLLSNGLKHTHTGGVVVMARMNGADLLEIEVYDTGPGVHPGEAEAIFEPFRQGRDAPSGSGLGLSLARAMARAMGGDLELVPCSQVTGACFRLTLQLDPVLTPPEVKPVPPPQGFTGARALIVDDIATNRLVARAHLGIYGLHCEEAADGETALVRIAADPPDLVLLDLSMPGLDGRETLTRLRALSTPAAQVKVVAMTAAGTEAVPICSATGFNGRLIKPLTPEAVGRMLTEQLGAPLQA